MVAAAIQLGADYVGIVHFPKSPRHVELERAGALAGGAGNRSVLLLVDPELPFLETAIRLVKPQIIQLHGHESPEFLAEIKRRNDVLLWKAIPVRTREDISKAAAYRGVADLILFDAKPPSDADLPGGNGLRFDWTLLRDHRPAYAWGLSGGLDPSNVSEAIRITQAPLVDVSSGVENVPGQKNVDKMTAFLKAIRT